MEILVYFRQPVVIQYKGGIVSRSAWEWTMLVIAQNRAKKKVGDTAQRHEYIRCQHAARTGENSSVDEVKRPVKCQWGRGANAQRRTSSLHLEFGDLDDMDC